MAIYRDLLYNNVQSFLASGFPVLRAISSDAYWHGLARDFFAHHRSHTPYFSEIGREFIEFVQNERDSPEDPGFLLELLHYERVELELMIDTRDPRALSADPNGDLLEGVPMASPLAVALRYQYPVHRIGVDHQPDEPPAEPTDLIVYRDRADEVGFLEANPVTLRLLVLLQENSHSTGKELLDGLAAELQHPRPELVIAHGRDILQRFRHLDILLGTRA